LRGNTRFGGAGRRRAARGLVAAALVFFATLASMACAERLPAQVSSTGVRLDSGRFTVVAERRDARLAQSMLAAAVTQDSFPGIARPNAHVLIAIAPDAKRFREWVGPAAPEWGAAVALPDKQRVIMQGGKAGSDAGDPLVVLRHELAHLALHEAMGALPPRWFDEGYASFAAHEWSRESAIEMSSGLVWHTLPTLEQLEDGFYAGASQASWSYALAYRAVEELAALDRQNGLTNFFREWKSAAAFEPAVRRAFGMTGEQFDKHWQQQTRRRFGALALVANLSAALGFFALLLGPLFWMRKRRDRKRLEAMRVVDAAQERAARESALEAILFPEQPGYPESEAQAEVEPDAVRPN